MKQMVAVKWLVWQSNLAVELETRPHVVAVVMFHSQQTTCSSRSFVVFFVISLTQLELKWLVWLSNGAVELEFSGQISSSFRDITHNLTIL
jgi:hypothetical protein